MVQYILTSGVIGVCFRPSCQRSCFSTSCEVKQTFCTYFGIATNSHRHVGEEAGGGVI